MPLRTPRSQPLDELAVQPFSVCLKRREAMKIHPRPLHVRFHSPGFRVSPNQHKSSLLELALSRCMQTLTRCTQQVSCWHAARHRRPRAFSLRPVTARAPVWCNLNTPCEASRPLQKKPQGSRRYNTPCHPHILKQLAFGVQLQCPVRWRHAPCSIVFRVTSLAHSVQGPRRLCRYFEASKQW